MSRRPIAERNESARERTTYPWLSVLAMALTATTLQAQNPDAPLGGEFQVNSHTTDSQVYPDVAVNNEGDFMVVWSSAGGQDGDGAGIFGQWFNRDGERLDNGVPVDEFRVNAYTTGLQAKPSVAAFESQTFAVVWESRGQDGDSDGVFFQVVSSTGRTLGADLQLNIYTTLGQRSPSVAVDGNGAWVVA